MKNAVGYARVSTQEQVSNSSLPHQKRSISDFCLNSELSLKRLFCDEGKSAWSQKTREELQKMLDYCRIKSNEIKFVVVYHPDRFARNLEEHVRYTKELNRLGI